LENIFGADYAVFSKILYVVKFKIASE